MQAGSRKSGLCVWIPAFAGMTLWMGPGITVQAGGGRALPCQPLAVLLQEAKTSLNNCCALSSFSSVMMARLPEA